MAFTLTNPHTDTSMIGNIEITPDAVTVTIGSRKVILALTNQDKIEMTYVPHGRSGEPSLDEFYVDLG